MSTDFSEGTMQLFLHRVRDGSLGGYSEQYLSEYFETWIERGGGIEETVGEFSEYLRAVVLTIAAWTEDPMLLDSKACNGETLTMRRPLGIVHPASENNFIDPYYYKRHLIRYLRGK